MTESVFSIGDVPGNEQERLSALQHYDIIDTASEAIFDDLLALAAEVFEAPILILSLVDAESVFFKASIGIASGKRIKRHRSPFALNIVDEKVLVIEDIATAGQLDRDSDFLTTHTLRFYAGAPLLTADGLAIGTFSIMDTQPRHFAEPQQRMLAGFARTAMNQLELRRSANSTLEESNALNLSLANMQQRLIDLNGELEATNEQLTETNGQLNKSYDVTVLLNKNLKKNEQRLKSFITKAPIAFAILTGRELKIEVANDMVLKVWRKTAAVIGHPIAIALPELQGQPYLDILDQVFTTGRTYIGDTAPVELEMDGIRSEHYFDFIYEPVKGEDGKTDSIIVIANEVTERIRQKENLEALNRQLEIALKAGELGTYILDIQQWKNYASPTCKSRLGLPSDETFEFEDFIRVITPEHREMVNTKVQEAIANKTPYQAEYLTVWPDGSLHWISSSGLTRYDAAGNPLDLIGVTVDVTKRKNYEAQKEDFLGIASHELKTPITSLNGTIQMLEMVKYKIPDQTISKLIDMSAASTRRITALVDDLLNMHRINVGQLELKCTYFSAEKMIQDCFDTINLLGKHQLHLTGDTGAVIHADEPRIEQVVANLINNAIKYAPSSYNIEARIEVLPHHVKVNIRDFGEGIDPAVQRQIFDRYYRAYPDGKKYSGLGLGLYISAEIIKRHGGEIGVDSDLGKGSNFWFTLPRAH